VDGYSVSGIRKILKYKCFIVRLLETFRQTFMKQHIPISLIIFRLLLAPIIFGLVYYYQEDSKLIVLILMYLGLISDIMDGIFARRFNVSSAGLRRFDSQTDMLFWLSIGISTWMLYPELIRHNAVPIIVIYYGSYVLFD
jgi:phosphatidylglycerophosphate synthase